MPEESQLSEALQEAESRATSSKKAFDVSKYTVSSTTESKTLYIDGTSFDVTVKPLSWSNRNRILSKSLQFDANGQTGFDGDFYVRECLKEMLVDAPWGRTTEPFLISIDHRLGTVLEELVPKAFDANEDIDGDLENLKDGQ